MLRRYKPFHLVPQDAPSLFYLFINLFFMKWSVCRLVFFGLRSFASCFFHYLFIYFLMFLSFVSSIKLCTSVMPPFVSSFNIIFPIKEKCGFLHVSPNYHYTLKDMQ